MPATVILVYDEHRTAKRFSDAFLVAGHQVVLFADPVEALQAIDNVHTAQLLITRVRFAPGRLNGLALASKAKHRRPEIKVLFLAFPEMKPQVDDLGDFLAMPASTADVVGTAERLMARP